MSTWRKILLAFVVVLLLAVAAFVIWASTPLGPMPEALAALESDAAVQVTTEPWYTFQPTGDSRSTGLIFYPGGRVDPRSYAPPARALAEQGYPVVIVPMPLNLAVFGADKAADVIAAMPEVDNWVIAGHSLGGSMAATFINRNPDAIDGLALWASYPAGSDDLSGRSDLAATSIYGTADGVAAMEDVLAGQPLLPAATVWAPIEGGNHAQFGWYGEQPGDT
ncbi:MAG TPA: alpha/beta hydrolase, partial [Anaerolineae bacterium]|nr:alpha/beta hydrolase [Anaerolineae bacterium]